MYVKPGHPSTSAPAARNPVLPGRPAAILAAALGTLAVGAGSTPAMAQQAVSADPEFITPRFGHNTVPGVAAADVDSRNTVRSGVYLQYQRNPVTGYRLDEEVGKIVKNRLAAHVGLSWDFADWGTARFILPGAVNWGTDIPDLEASGPGLGDVSVGLAFVPLQTRWFNLGVQGDVFLPTGRPRAYIGEGTIRGSGGLMAMVKVPSAKPESPDIFDLALDATVVGRATVDTRQDFELGPELVLGQSARLKLPWIPLAFTQNLVARSGFTNFFQPGAETGFEVLGGVQVPVRDVGFNTHMVFDVMAGRGGTQGYGTTDFRVLAGFTVIRNPGKKPRPEIVEVKREPPPVIPPVVEEIPPVDWGEPEPPAQLVGEQIVIRDPIDFKVDTSIILDHSLPVLEAVAQIMNEKAEIKHLVIEGHASAEGDHEYNYELSGRRAEAIFRQLILNGVPPERMSFRSMGETRPKVEGDTEEAYAQNRRVEFHVVAQYVRPEDIPQSYGDKTILPWNGEASNVVTPPPPPPPEKPKDEFEKAEELEKARRGEFEDELSPEEDDFSFEGEETEPEATDEAEDPFSDTSFDSFGGGEDFSFDGEGSDSEAGSTGSAPTGGTAGEMVETTEDTTESTMDGAQGTMEEDAGSAATPEGPTEEATEPAEDAAGGDAPDESTDDAL